MKGISHLSPFIQQFIQNLRISGRGAVQQYNSCLLYTSTSFFVTSVIPLIPGSTLYYCMNSIVEGNTVRALEYGRDTFLFAFGIAAGMSIAWSICYFLRSVRKKQN